MVTQSNLFCICPVMSDKPPISDDVNCNTVSLCNTSDHMMMFAVLTSYNIMSVAQYFPGDIFCTYDACST